MKTPHHKTATRIKLCVYYSHRIDGTPFTQYEIQQSLNLRKIPIYDGEYTVNGKYILRYDKGVKKARRHIALHEATIITAIIVYHHWSKGNEYVFGIYTRGKGWNFPEPTYKTDEHGHVTIKHFTILMPPTPIRQDTLNARFVDLKNEERAQQSKTIQHAR